MLDALSLERYYFIYRYLHDFSDFCYFDLLPNPFVAHVYPNIYDINSDEYSEVLRSSLRTNIRNLLNPNASPFIPQVLAARARPNILLNPNATSFVPDSLYHLTENKCDTGIASSLISNEGVDFHNYSELFDTSKFNDFLSAHDISTPILSESSEIEAERNDLPDIEILVSHDTSVLNDSPDTYDISTPVFSELSESEATENVYDDPEISVTHSITSTMLDETPIAHNISSPVLTEVNSVSSSSSGDFLNKDELFHKYISKEFCKKNDTTPEEVSQVLKGIRIENINRVVIGHLNVNFFAVKLDAIKTIIPGNVDIMIFCETKLDDSYPTAQLMIDGFRKPFRRDRNARGGGILIYVRSDIPCRQLNRHEFDDKIEGVFVEINLRKSKWLLFGTYHPPSQDDNFYFENVGRALDVYTKKYDKVLLVGDFNAEEDECILGDFLELYDLRNLVKEKTCFKSVENPSCVDLFLTNNYRSFQNTKVVSTGISDCHKMIITVLKTTFRKAKPRELIYRCYRNFNNEKFSADLGDKISNCRNCSEYQSCFLEVFNAHAPLKKKVIRANEVPYMTKALRKAIANRSRLENRYYKDRTEESLRAYRKQKNFCSRLYKKERKRYYANLDVKKITDSRKFWKTVKPFLSDKGTSKTEIILIENDEIIQDDSEVAKVLNEFFSDAVKSLGVEIPCEHLDNHSCISEDPIEQIICKYANHPSIKRISENVETENEFFFNEVSLSDVEKVVAALDSKKATSCDSIPTKVLQENSDFCCTPLTYIINNDITSSNFDSCLKRADVAPVHKADDTTDKTNYRNVSLLPIISKVFEKIMQPQILSYVEKFLSPFLCGYRKGYSAQHALLCMLEKWKVYLDKGGYGGGVLMDLSKAFDTLDHDLLIAKLHAYGFSKNALKFIKSYLSDRWQRVKINNSYSSWSALLKGVPQGSVLGPLLFNLYINDLFYVIDTDICNFADDNTPNTVDMSLDELMTKLERVSEKAMIWFDDNGMKLNSKKCHLLVSGHKHECMICNIGTRQVIETHEVKLLGINIDSDLSFNSYLKVVCLKASKKLNALSRLFSILPLVQRKMLMEAFFVSLFSYCPLVWMFHSRKMNKKINDLHYRALRMVYCDNTSSFDKLLEKDGSVTIHKRNLQFLAIEMYKVFKKMAPLFMDSVFGKNLNAGTENVSANTRSNKNFYNRYNPKTVKYGLETLRSLGPKIWSMIPVELKNTPSLPLFKSKIKEWVPQNCPCRMCKSFVPQLGFL